MSVETDLADGVVLVLRPNGCPAGTGFAVSERLLVTCSHVVQPVPGIPPPETVNVVFHATGKTRKTRVSAEATVIRKWRRGSEAEDIAFLRVDHLPGQVKVLPLGSADEVGGDTVKAFGYPETRGIEGLWAPGDVVGTVIEAGHPLLQLHSNEITAGFSGGPLLDLRKQQVIGMVTAIIEPDRYGKRGWVAFATPTEELRKFCPELRLPEVPPYCGLSPFDAEHAEFFCGRDKLVEGLVSGLRAHSRFLALLGPSGSGKSSVIGAGLIPSLETDNQPGIRDWGTVTIRPHADPFAELAGQGLDGRRLTESFGQWIRASGCQRGLLVIDQFEELLVLTPTGLRADFVAQLVKLLDSSLPVTVVLVMRDDFYGRLGDRAPALLRWMDRRLLNILPLERDELRAIVTEPAEKAGLHVGEGLAEVILEEAKAMGAEGGAIPSTILPLVELALTALWEQNQRSHPQGALTLRAYQDLGGISHALTVLANDAYDGLDDQMRPVARSILLDLVHVADEERMPDIRQRKDLSTLCQAIGDRGLVEEVVSMLAAKRLVITGGKEKEASVELIHDVLVQKWDQLRSWISEERPFRRWLQEMKPSLRAWTDYVGRNRSGEEPDWLRGQRLTEAERWLASRGIDLPPDLKELIEDSRREQDDEEKRERQLEALRLVGHSEQAMHTTPPAPVVALALAVESVLTEPTVQGDIAIRRVLRLHPRTLARFGHDRRVTSVAFSPDGTRLATGSTDKTARVFEAMPGLLVQRALRAMDRPLNPAELGRYELGPDCRHIREWDRLTGQHAPRSPAGN